MRMRSAAIAHLRCGLGGGDRPRGDDAREDDREGAALAEGAAQLDATALRLGQPLGERQAEAGALVALGRAAVDLLELDEQLVEVLRRDADAGVLDLQPVAIVP